MSRVQPPRSLYAAVLLCPVLLASTPAFAQQVHVSTVQPQSIISLAPALKPQGEILARHATDARFESAPANYHVFAAATAGEDAGVESLTLNFAGETRLTGIQSKNKDFVLEPGGTCHEGNSYSRGDSCTMLVRFNPQGPGHRLGFLTISHTAQATPLTVGLTGNGYSPVVSFTPSQITTVAPTVSAGKGTIKSATSLAANGGDIVYISDTGNGLLKEIDSTGAITPTSSFFDAPGSIAVDSLGIVYSVNAATTWYFSYYVPWGVQTGWATPYAAGACTEGVPCALATVGMGSPANASIDANDNLFFEERTRGAAEMPVGTTLTNGDNLYLWYLEDVFPYTPGPTPESFAADAAGNIYTSYLYSPAHTCLLVEEPLYTAETTTPIINRVAGAANCGFSGDGGQARNAEISSTMGQMAFDVAGNLYFADAGNQRVRRIDNLTGIITTIAGDGTAGYTGDGGAATSATLSNPTGVAVDSAGQVYILSNAPTAGPTQVLRKVSVTGFLDFGSQLRSTISKAYVVNVSNTGNDTLTLSYAAFFNGASPTQFAIDPNTTTCPLGAGANLYAGHSCKVGVVFKPTVAGVMTANLVLQNNTVTGTNIVELLGAGTLPYPTMKITSPVAGSTLTAGTPVTFAVSVTSTATTKPTGTVTFKANGIAIGSPVTLSTTGTASVQYTPPSATTYTLSAAYSGDTNYAPLSVSESLIASAAITKVSLVSTSNSPTSCTAVGFSTHVSSNSGASPTGTVELKSGAVVLATSTLVKGAATLSTHALTAGKHSLVATYSGDKSHAPSTSSTVSLTIQAAGSNCSSHNQAPAGLAPIL